MYKFTINPMNAPAKYRINDRVFYVNDLNFIYEAQIIAIEYDIPVNPKYNRAKDIGIVYILSSGDRADKRDIYTSFDEARKEVIRRQNES